MSLALKKEIISLIDNANIDDESMKHIKDYIKMHIKIITMIIMLF